MNKRTNLLTKVMLVVLAFTLVLTGCNLEQKDEEILESQQELEQMEEKIDADTGLVYEGSMELKYAKSFSVNYYKGGYKTIVDWNGRKTLLVPEGKEVPEVKSDIDVIQLPIKSIGAFTSVVAAELRPLELIDKMTLVTTERDRWHIPEVKQMMDEGQITYVGKNSAPDYELIESINPDLILITVKTVHGENDVITKFDEMGVKWISHGSQRETDPRGRLEWIKLIGALLDKEEEAEDFYEAQLKKIAEVEEKVANLEGEKKKFASTFFSKDIYYVRNKGDYEVKMYELSGGEYILSELNPEEDGNTKMNAEELYKGIEDVDILFYNTILGRSVQSIDDLVSNAEYLKDVKAIKEGRVWGYKPHYYQYSDQVADMIVDLYTIFTTPHGEITETDFFFLME
ncbi:ABC transporter substrate-binding protein [Schnuerera sp.]|uniref:ABC transporter substrate-binding protein n=1 Tax=Schnuerera sp. TaxID=2794844 RepID=UPI002C591711|nr:ABC transporter substrate-binding protein [Schnuerera sp.]HSH37012.1 ABC transporter substrate-binding protein [Schnuerera sp.]